MSLSHFGKFVGHPVHKRRPTAFHHSQGVIDISSDEETPRPPPKKSLANPLHLPPNDKLSYDTQLSQKDEEIEKLKKREKELEQVVATQKNEIDAKELQAITNVHVIEEELSCDVCAEIMWTPYRLTECGHVFCRGCLIDWFDTTHVQFLNSHPDYTPPSSELQEALRRPYEFPQECGRAYVLLSRSPSPKYTCLTCRARVTRRPIEDFKVKALVSCFCSVSNIKPPESGIPPGAGDTIFDGYAGLL